MIYKSGPLLLLLVDGGPDLSQESPADFYSTLFVRVSVDMLDKIVTGSTWEHSLTCLLLLLQMICPSANNVEYSLMREPTPRTRRPGKCVRPSTGPAAVYGGLCSDSAGIRTLVQNV